MGALLSLPLPTDVIHFSILPYLQRPVRVVLALRLTCRALQQLVDNEWRLLSVCDKVSLRLPPSLTVSISSIKLPLFLVDNLRSVVLSTYRHGFETDLEIQRLKVA